MCISQTMTHSKSKTIVWRCRAHIKGHVFIAVMTTRKVVFPTFVQKQIVGIHLNSQKIEFVEMQKKDLALHYVFINANAEKRP